MYVPLQVNRSQECILLIVQYKYTKSCSGDFYSPESDPPHKIMQYCVYYSTQLVFGFPPDRICHIPMNVRRPVVDVTMLVDVTSI